MPITEEQAKRRQERSIYGAGGKPKGQKQWNQFNKKAAAEEAKNPTPWRYDAWGILRGPQGAPPPQGMPSRGEPGTYPQSTGDMFGSLFGGSGTGVGSGTGATGGAAGGGSLGSGTGAGGVGGAANTAQLDPFVLEQINRYRDRFSSDVTKRAIDKSNLGIADSAALMAADAKGGLSSRGVLGTGTGAAYLNKRIFQPAQREAAGRAADIAMGRERDLDALTLGGTSLMTAPAAISLADRGLALQQHLGTTDQALRARQLEEDNKARTMSMIFGLYGDMLRSQPQQPFYGGY